MPTNGAGRIETLINPTVNVNNLQSSWSWSHSIHSLILSSQLVCAIQENTVLQQV